MDWTNILGFVIGGGGVMGIWELVKWLYTRKDEKRGIQIDNEHKSVDAANDTTHATLELVESLKDEVRSVREENKDLTERNRTLRDQIDQLRTERGIGTMLLCRNAACMLRNPEMGQGPKWFDDYDIGNITDTMDSRPMEEIAEEKGYTLVRNMLNKEEG